jgi:outer membrane lipoprotein-sorting protein
MQLRHLWHAIELWSLRTIFLKDALRQLCHLGAIKKEYRMKLRATALAALVLAGFAGSALAQTAPAPPRRPSDPAPGTPPPPSGSGPMRLNTDVTAPPARPTTTTPSAASPAAGALSEEAALDRVNTYMNSFRTLIADFTQLGADGRKYEGKLYIQRPGRMRFEYRPPATIEVISDGTTVAVRDKKLATQENYLIGQTPLKFLLKEQVDLKRDVKVTRVTSTADLIRVTVEDRATLGGTSRITLHYDPKANRLRQWVIIDPQGYETSVQVANLDTGRRPDPELFKINLERILENRN